MAKSAPRLAILGAGPIGLEAGLYAKTLGWPFTIFERGRIGEHMLRWGHVRLFSPFGMNATLLGKQAIGKQKLGHEFPADDACVLGREHVAAYLNPLGELLKENLVGETQVLKISRQDLLKNDEPGDLKRARNPFRLLVRDKQRERIETADVVLDCTGVYAQHRWAGAGGMPAPGELSAETHIAYQLEDILGERKGHYANRTILVVGAGFSAATTVCNLAEISLEHQTTWVIWVARTSQTTPLRRFANDPLKERDRFASRANSLATRTDDNVEYSPATVVDAIEYLGQDKGFKVTLRSPLKTRVVEVDRIIANVGYSPDTNLYRELQVRECPASLASQKMADAVALAKVSDPLRMSGLGAEALRNPEPNFYILGAKSLGRNSNFLLRLGFEQIRDAFALMAGNPNLDLYAGKK
ncbi:MAG: NAD(P)/FAD-dependent oxidoreductase [Gemmataceae bacterium]|nr:NAD(P)/FAD-dependent oxidoreductase [Gemmataceae bacterium]